MSVGFQSDRSQKIYSTYSNSFFEKLDKICNLVIMDMAVKNKIVERILQSNDELLLNEVKALVGLTDKDFGADLPDEVKQAVAKAAAQLDAGEGMPHNMFMNEVRNKFPGRKNG